MGCLVNRPGENNSIVSTLFERVRIVKNPEVSKCFEASIKRTSSVFFNISFARTEFKIDTTPIYSAKAISAA